MVLSVICTHHVFCVQVWKYLNAECRPCVPQSLGTSPQQNFSWPHPHPKKNVRIHYLYVIISNCSLLKTTFSSKNPPQPAPPGPGLNGIHPLRQALGRQHPDLRVRHGHRRGHQAFEDGETQRTQQVLPAAVDQIHEALACDPKKNMDHHNCHYWIIYWIEKYGHLEMIPLTNHDFQWARSELVIIYPDNWHYWIIYDHMIIKLYTSNYISPLIHGLVSAVKSEQETFPIVPWNMGFSCREIIKLDRYSALRVWVGEYNIGVVGIYIYIIHSVYIYIYMYIYIYLIYVYIYICIYILNICMGMKKQMILSWGEQKGCLTLSNYV